jgi:[acyl-carrier-protein] S-malonyltransferase
MTKTAWVFPGQGSQAVGMGLDLLDIPEAKEKFTKASELLGWSVIDRIQGDVTELSKTLYTQPCLYIVEAILADQLKSAGQTPDFVAGHSLGEYSALYAAGVFSFESGLKIIQTRSQLMDSTSSGIMVALLAFNRTELETAIEATDGVVMANDNHPGQVVISGEPDAVDSIIASVKCKPVRLNVSGGFHSPLMSTAADHFSAFLKDMPFNDAQIPVLSNTDPTPCTNAVDLKARLSRQMTGSVRWREISLALPDLGVTAVTEVGPGKVLIGVMKRTCPDMVFAKIGTQAELAAFS